jgi:hypothetical protein
VFLRIVQEHTYSIGNSLKEKNDDATWLIDLYEFQEEFFYNNDIIDKITD